MSNKKIRSLTGPDGDLYANVPDLRAFVLAALDEMTIPQEPVQPLPVPVPDPAPVPQPGPIPEPVPVPPIVIQPEPVPVKGLTYLRIESLANYA